MEYAPLLELASIAFTLLLAFPNLFINLDDREKEEWILNFYRFIATKLLIPSMAYLSSVLLILANLYTGFEVFGELSLMLLIVTTSGFFVFLLVGLTYARIRVMIERSVEREFKSHTRRGKSRKATSQRRA